MTARGTNLATLGAYTLSVHCALLLAKGSCTLVCLAHSTGLIHRNPGSGTRRFYVAERPSAKSPATGKGREDLNNTRGKRPAQGERSNETDVGKEVVGGVLSAWMQGWVGACGADWCLLGGVGMGK